MSQKRGSSLFQLSSPEHGRGTKYLGSKYHNALNMLLLLLPGGALTYYGEEIGMEPVAISWHDTKDIYARTAGVVNTVEQQS